MVRYVGRWRMEDGRWSTLLAGGRGTETTVLLKFAMLIIVEQGLCALFSSNPPFINMF